MLEVDVKRGMGHRGLVWMFHASNYTLLGAQLLWKAMSWATKKPEVQGLPSLKVNMPKMLVENSACGRSYLPSLNMSGQITQRKIWSSSCQQIEEMLQHGNTAGEVQLAHTSSPLSSANTKALMPKAMVTGCSGVVSSYSP